MSAEFEVGSHWVLGGLGLAEVTEHRELDGRQMAALHSPTGITMMVPIANMANACRRPVTPTKAANALGKLVGVPEADPSGRPFKERFEAYGEILAGFDFDDQVSTLQHLYAVDRKANVAAITLARYFENVVLSEVSYVLDVDMEELRRKMPQMARP